MSRYRSFRLPILLLFCTVVLSTFGLAVLWEFWGEGQFLGLSAHVQEESAAQHWHYVFTATAFVVLSLLGPFGFILRRERIRLALEEELRHAAVVFENTLDGVMITDRLQRIVTVNRSFMEITGYAAADVLGKSQDVLKSRCHDETFYDRIRQSLSASGHWRGEIWNRRKNGEPFPVWESISEVRDSDGEPSHYVAVFSDISSIKRTQEELAHLANHDPLTGLPNRNLFQDRLEHALQGARRRGESSAVIFMDLDRFKNVNDTFGHPAGDQLLCSVAKRLQDCVRGTDTVARLGGDEFIVLLERIRADADAQRVVSKIQAALARPVEVHGHEVFVSASMGISVYPRNGEQGTELIRNADAAMYRAKELGRGGCQFYTAELTRTTFEDFTPKTSLRHALEREEFPVSSQPQISLKNGEITGVEVLNRWQRPGKDAVALQDATGLRGSVRLSGVPPQSSPAARTASGRRGRR